MMSDEQTSHTLLLSVLVQHSSVAMYAMSIVSTRIQYVNNVCP